MTNIRRNQLCPCGSGKKYKRCHGAFPVDASPWPPLEVSASLEQKFRETEALRLRREKQQGLGRPIVAAKMNAHQLVAVGNRMHFSPNWKTFHDFLRDFFFNLLGREWLEAEQAKQASGRHKILRWFHQAMEDTHRSGTKYGDVYTAPMTGAVQAFINLAYNIYLVAHHTDKDGDRIISAYIDRLKSDRADDFSGALFETYAAAAFLKAGFKIVYENETDSSVSHVEFVAEYPKTAKKFSVEVKTRERSLAIPAGADSDVDDVKRLRVASKLNKALGKRAEHTRVVLVEINVPDLITGQDGWPTAARKQIRDNEKTDFPGGEKKPSAYVFVTNHAFHNNLASTSAGVQVLAAGFHIPDFGPDACHTGYKGILESRERHCEMFSLLKSMQTHYEIPSTFDGEMPELAFQNSDGLPRMQFGRWYVVPTMDGREVPGRLYDAVVDEHLKSVTGCYQIETGESLVVTCPISDAELAAYRRYPDTFFGQVRHVPPQPRTLVDLCDFFYETYKDTPRDRALGWMAGSPDCDYLNTLSQKDLAIVLCERWALSALNGGQRPGS